MKPSTARIGRVLLFVLAVLAIELLLEFVTRVGLMLDPLDRLAPDWWLPSASKGLHHLSWVHLSTTLGLLIALAPVGAALAVFVRRRALALAWWSSALLLALHPMVWRLGEWFDWNGLARASVVFDLVKQGFLLPLTTWAVLRLTGWLRARSRASAPTEDGGA